MRRCTKCNTQKVQCFQLLKEFFYWNSILLIIFSETWICTKIRSLVIFECNYSNLKNRKIELRKLIRHQKSKNATELIGYWRRANRIFFSFARIRIRFRAIMRKWWNIGDVDVKYRNVSYQCMEFFGDLNFMQLYILSCVVFNWFWRYWINITFSIIASKTHEKF